MEQTTTGSRVGHGQRNSTQGPLVVFNGLTFGLVVHITVLSGFRKVELLDVLSKTGRQVAHQEVRLLHGFLRVDQVVLHFRADDGVGQARGRGVCASRGTPVGFSVVSSEEVVKNVTGVGQEVGR